MINLLQERTPLWQSCDGIHEHGWADLNGRVAYSVLGQRPLIPEDAAALLMFLRQVSPSSPLLLLSSCPGFEPNTANTAMAVLASQIMALQYELRDQGCRLVSAVSEIAVGGTYLMHGLSAPHRLATDTTRFYGALASGTPSAIESALAQELITEILPLGQIQTRLCEILGGSR